MLAPPEQDALDRLVTDVRQALEPDDFDAAWGEGEALSFDRKITYALEEHYARG